MSKENNQTAEQMPAELAVQLTTREAVRASLIGKEMGAATDSSESREPMLLLEETGLKVEASALTPVVAEQITAYAQEAVQVIEEQQYLPEEVTFAVTAAEKAVELESGQSGTGRRFLFENLRPELARLASTVAIMIMLLTGCVLPDIAQASTQTPDVAAATNDNTEQSLEDVDIKPTTANTLATATKTPLKPAATKTPVQLASGSDTVEPTETATPEAVVTAEATATPLPVLKVENGTKKIPAVYIREGVNVRTSPEYDPTNKDKNLYKLDIGLPTEFEATGEVIAADGYNWIQFLLTDSAGNEETLYVAEVSGVTKTVLEIPTTEVGGVISDAQLVREAVDVLPEISQAAYAVGEYNNLPAVVDKDGNILAIKGADGNWVINALINLGADVEELGDNAELVEMTDLEVKLFGIVPPNVKAEVINFAFNPNGYWDLPEGRVPGMTAYYPVQTKGVASIEQGAFNPKDGVELLDENGNAGIEFFIAGENPLVANLEWIGGEERAQQLVAQIRAELGTKHDAIITFVATDDVTGTDASHLGGKRMSFDSAFNQADKRLLMIGSNLNAQVITNTDSEGAISDVVVYVSIDHEYFRKLLADPDEKIRKHYETYTGHIFAMDTIVQGVMAAKMVIEGESGKQDYYALTWIKQYADRLDTVMYPDIKNPKSSFDYTLAEE